MKKMLTELHVTGAPRKPLDFCSFAEMLSGITFNKNVNYLIKILQAFWTPVFS